jgi:hypothetical protein
MLLLFLCVFFSCRVLLTSKLIFLLQLVLLLRHLFLFFAEHPTLCKIVTNMSATYRLVALGLILFSIIISIVAAATTSWIVIGSFRMGLFWVCGGNSCTKTLNALSGDEPCRSKDQAAQAFIVLAIITMFPLFAIVLMRRFFASSTVGGAVVRNVSWMIDVALSAFIAIALVIAWACVAGMHDECICNNNTQNCGLNYSWALALIASVAVMVVTVLLFLSKEGANAVHDGSAVAQTTVIHTGPSPGVH